MDAIRIESVEPEVDGGRFPAKRLAGGPMTVLADIYKDGHDVLRAQVVYRQVTPLAEQTEWRTVPMQEQSNDRWAAELTLPRPGRYAFTIEAWTDAWASFVTELDRKVKAGWDVRSELLEGAALLESCAGRAAKARADADARALREAARAVKDGAVPRALDPGLQELTARHPDRAAASRYERSPEVMAEPPRVEAGAWYELFPRSASRDPSRHGTFRDAEQRLPEIAAMGFDVVYLAPIHPIGRTARKGRNNAPAAQKEDVGSPWAIGAGEGGHTAVHPRLGTLEDFRHFVRRAEALGMDVALDLAFQCSPDHPYLREHPEWFAHRPDGTIKHAENPPKRYEDIVNFDWLGPHRQALWDELKRVVLFWIDQGVRIFRVDNPHTKPVPFWEWLLREVKDLHPSAVFLSEAFTRPKMMKQLAKVGFSQSYTYFTWRNFKDELRDYLEEITTAPAAEYFRGNLWPNTPDIFPTFLHGGGPPAFRIRLALAATLSSSYGIYSGYELCEGRPLGPGLEEYLDSEKYQLVARDPDRPGHIRDLVAALNRVRKEHPALREYRNLRFHHAQGDRVLFYGKRSRDGADQVLVAVSLDPFEPQEAVLEVPLEQLGLGPDERYQVHELLSDRRSLWKGRWATASLTPEHPAAIWHVLRFHKRENDFDYFA
ncbi:MAG TPA: alpha-1,4-glucan--maltose-1-phosphate maltosyltransferase [Myxococcaceae bacterium]|jgi:starch synthase (maltosyl-transferring)